MALNVDFSFNYLPVVGNFAHIKELYGMGLLSRQDILRYAYHSFDIDQDPAIDIDTQAPYCVIKAWFQKEQAARFPTPPALSGIVFVNRNGLRWRDAPSAYGPHKTLYNRWKRWSERGVFVRMMEGLAAADAEPKTVMIDATYLKAHRTASSLRVKRGASAG